MMTINLLPHYRSGIRKRRQCPQRHDTWLGGRATPSGTCRECSNIASKRWIVNNSDRVKTNRRTKNWTAKGLGGSNGTYAERLARQCGACAICERVPDNHQLQVDHDHQSGKFRGLLCIPCNTGLGWFGDNEEGIQKVLTYVQRTNP